MVKAEMQKNEQNGTIAVAFEGSRAEDHDLLDTIYRLIMGNDDRRGGYINSDRIVVHIKES